jgi:hypothetical protein
MTTVVNEAELAVDHLRETERARRLGSFDRGQDATAGRSQNNPRRHHAERNSGAHDGNGESVD